MADDTKDQGQTQAQDKPRGRGRQLGSNVLVVTEDNPQGTWHGPDYEDAGAPPSGALADDHPAWVQRATEPAELAGMMELEGAAEEDREFDDADGDDGAEQTGDRHRSREAADAAALRRRAGVRR
jgi:hypothetical protein